jgi:hypothetical protein
VSRLATSLRDVHATVLGLESSLVNQLDNQGDSMLIAEARVACDLATGLMLNNSVVLARYACIYAEVCVAATQNDERSTSRLRKLIEELLQSGKQI